MFRTMHLSNRFRNVCCFQIFFCVSLISSFSVSTETNAILMRLLCRRNSTTNACKLQQLHPLRGGSKKNSLKLRKIKHKADLEEAMTERLRGIMKRAKKCERWKRSIANMSNSTASDLQSPAYSNQQQRPSVLHKMAETALKDGGESLPIFPNPKKRHRKASRKVKSAYEKRAERRAKRMKLRFEKYGRDIKEVEAALGGKI